MARRHPTTTAHARRSHWPGHSGAELRRRPKQSGKLEAGWAAREFKLEDWPLAGYGARRGARSAGQRDPLFARCVFLRTEHAAALIVCTDLLLVHPEVAAAVERGLAGPDGNTPWPILFTSTHTHCGPGAWGRNWLEESVTGPHDPEATRRLASAIVECAAAAVSGAQPAAWGWLDLVAPAHLRNRTLAGGPVDASLETLVLRRKADGARALVSLYGAHATCLPSSVLEYAGDYPGHFVQALETGGSVEFAAFAAGVVGSHSPKMPDGTKADPERIGNDLAGIVSSALETAVLRETADLRAISLASLPLPPLRVRLNRALRLAPATSRLLHPGTTRIAGLGLDEHLWLGLPFELSGMLSPAMRAKARTLNVELHLSCFCGDYLGYVLPDDLYADHSLYEAQMNFLGPGGGSFVTRLVNGVTESAAGAHRKNQMHTTEEA